MRLERHDHDRLVDPVLRERPLQEEGPDLQVQPDLSMVGLVALYLLVRAGLGLLYQVQEGGQNDLAVVGAHLDQMGAQVHPYLAEAVAHEIEALKEPLLKGAEVVLVQKQMGLEEVHEKVVTEVLHFLCLEGEEPYLCLVGQEGLMGLAKRPWRVREAALSTVEQVLML